MGWGAQHIHIYKHTHTYVQSEMQTAAQFNVEESRAKGIQGKNEGEQTDRQTERQGDRDTGRQRQTETYKQILHYMAIKISPCAWQRYLAGVTVTTLAGAASSACARYTSHTYL